MKPVDRTMHVLLWLTIGVNALLGMFTVLGWFGRPRGCPKGCPWRPAGGMLWVLLVIVDVGLVLVWAGVVYPRLVAVGERIGRRISATTHDEDRDGG